MRRGHKAGIGASALISLALLVPAGAQAGKLATGFTVTEPETLRAPDFGTRKLWMDRAVESGAGYLRLNVEWRAAAPSTRPADPADPSVYNLQQIDREVISARQAGLEPMLMVYNAPDYAREGTPPSHLADRPGAWQPVPAELALFARALATRYDGAHGLPRVTYFQAWVEPNLAIYLAPQWQNGKTVVSAGRYRNLLNAFFDAVKAVNPTNKVVTAGTAPFGDPVGQGVRPDDGIRTRPLAFWRQVLCIKPSLKKASCGNKAKFDILAHHPINRDHEPSWKPRSKDDLVPSTVSALTKVLRAAEKQGTLGTGGRHPLWATEIWLESNPPDKKWGHKQAGQFMQETLYLIARAGITAVMNLQIRDSKLDQSGSARFFNVQSGLWYHPSFRNGAKKRDLFTAFRFPIWADRRSKKKVRVWGRAPESGKVRIQVKKGKKGFKTVKKLKAGRQKTFQKNVRLKGKGKVRVKMAGEKTLPVKVKKK